MSKQKKYSGYESNRPIVYRLFIDCTRHQAARELDQLHEQDDHNIGENHGVGRKSEVTLMDR
jgi:hypothetical protein